MRGSRVAFPAAARRRGAGADAVSARIEGAEEGERRRSLREENERNRREKNSFSLLSSVYKLNSSPPFLSLSLSLSGFHALQA